MILKMTMELRWSSKAVYDPLTDTEVRVLQQKWIDENGKSKWIEIPIESSPPTNTK